MSRPQQAIVDLSSFVILLKYLNPFTEEGSFISVPHFAMNFRCMMIVPLSWITILIICIFCLQSVHLAPNSKASRTLLPTFVKVCRRTDPQLDICARNSLAALKPQLKYGIPELFIPPIEPLVIPEIRMDQDTGAIYLQSTYKNVHLRGLSNFTVDQLLIDTSRMRLTLTTTFPNVTLHGWYILKGKIMMMPLAGEGDFQANFTDVELSTVIQSELVSRNSVQFVRVRDIKVSYNVGKVGLYLGNLFNGERALGERMNEFLNENWESLAEEVRPMLEKAMIEVVRSSTDQLFDAYSYDDLLPE